MKVVTLLFHVFWFGCVQASFPHKEVYSERDRACIAKISRAILNKHETEDIHVYQARQKAKLEDMCFCWAQDSITKDVTVTLWLAYDLMNGETQQKEHCEECFQDFCFSKEEIKKLKLGTFYKKIMQSHH